MKKLLFITWDGPQTSYMEGLFMPIFHAINNKDHSLEFHILQFTWAGKEKTNQVAKKAAELGIHYRALPILKKPVASLGSLVTLYTSSGKIKKYIKQHNIDIVMPRSTFPAFMVKKIRNKDFKIIFDADGLSIEERVDFAGLKRNSFLYKFLKSTETKMLKNADVVMTRSQKAIDIYIENIGENFRPKFFVVKNGKDKNLFSKNNEFRSQARKELNLNREFLFVYAGSLGPQYCFPEMLEIFRKYAENKQAKFLILTGNITFAEENIPQEISSKIIVNSVASDKVPFYLNAADCAFALRQPKYSMQGVAPIKLGEYLLCGLPVIASKGIGDTEEILQEFEECFLYDHNLDSKENLYNVQEYIKNCIFTDPNKIREKALQHFSLEASALSYLNAIYSLS